MSDLVIGQPEELRLSEEEMERAFQAFKDGVAKRGYMDKGPAMDGLRAVLEALIPAHTERAWDEAHDAFCPRSIVCSTHGRPGDRHRIYAARQEQDR